MEKAYKFRIYPNKEQEILIQKTFGCSRFVFNKYLAKRKESYEASKESISLNSLCLDLTQIKKEFEWLREVDSTALQASIKDLDTAYQNFYRRVKKARNPDSLVSRASMTTASLLRARQLARISNC